MTGEDELHMAPGDFDPLQLTTDASINRLEVAGLAGVPARLAGQRALAILSADAVAALAAEHAMAVRRSAIADDIGAALGGPDLGARASAQAVAGEIGLRLACVLATLRDPGTAVSQGWNEWRRAYLRHWATVDEVHLAGGVLAGAVGTEVVTATRAALGRLGSPVRVALTPRPAWAALIGAARKLGAEPAEVVAVDLGGSAVKTGLVSVLSGGALEPTCLTRTPVPFDQRDQPAAEVLDGLVATSLASAARAAERRGATVRGVAVSVACYLDGSRRCAASGVYANLPDLGGDAWRRRLEELFAWPVAFGVFHDGTAAAAAMPRRGRERGATLVLGTALGVGFAPRG